MRSILITLFLLTSSIAISQERNDFGVVVGTSYYMGDYNLSTQFYQPSPSIGALLKHNFTNLFALRLSASYGNLKGSHSNDNFYLPGNTSNFTKTFIEANLVAEFGFLPFSIRQSHQNKFSPYVLIGAGGAYINGSIVPQFPMGIGLKYSPINRLSVGIEWRLHKTIYDSIDQYKNISEEPRSIIHNNDWFGIAGIVVTYRLINKGAICPAYE
ncbi:MAG: hypothetical protein CVT98_06775 [Bacteroidetes bacterium HGW-Bacteroidetes-15]|nr:MAG: hypothetical protein CVT98_06775 [Bacteroidetes bacterium HGW-Bacteroidetes-15]